MLFHAIYEKYGNFSKWGKRLQVQKRTTKQADKQKIMGYTQNLASQ